MAITNYCGLKLSVNETERLKHNDEIMRKNTIAVAVLVEGNPIGIIRAPKKNTQAFCERAVRANMFTGQPLYPHSVAVSYQLVE